jgi:hypothetical protein
MNRILFFIFLIFNLVSCSVFKTEPYGKIEKNTAGTKSIISFHGEKLNKGDGVKLFRNSREQKYTYQKLISEGVVINVFPNEKYEIEFENSTVPLNTDVIRLKQAAPTFEPQLTGGKL